MKHPLRSLLRLLFLSALVTAGSSQLLASTKVEQTIKEILERQNKKGDVLNVYLKNAQGTYVNGKQISTDMLETVAGRSYLKEARITAEPTVPLRKIIECQEALRKGGIRKIQLLNRQQKETPVKSDFRKSAQAAGKENTKLSDHPVNKREAAITEILHRQEKKGDELQVYLRDEKRLYVNGRQISMELLQDLIPRAKITRVTLSVEPHVTQGRVIQMMELIRDRGIKKIQLTHPKPE